MTLGSRKGYLWRNKVLLIVSLSLFTIWETCAQETINEVGLSWGVRAGISVASFGNTQPYLTPKPGLYLGGIAEYTPIEWFSVQLRLGYNQLGGNMVTFEDASRFIANDNRDVPFLESEEPVAPIEDKRETGEILTSKSSVTVHAIELPILARFGYDLEGLRIFVSTGFSPSYQLYVSEKFEQTLYLDQTFLSFTETESASNDYEAFQVGVLGGVGILFSAGDKRIAFDVSYQRGLTPLKKSHSYIGLQTSQGDLYADSFLMGIEFMF